MMERHAISIRVGETLRRLRETKGLSLRALARLSGLSANALSMIERGRSSATVSTLFRVAEAMQIPISRLFQVDEKRQAVVFRKAAERTRLALPRGLWEGLGGEAFDGPVEPLALTLETGAGSGRTAMSHTGHEFVVCLCGNLEYQVGMETFLLEAGDSLLFRAHMNHRWRNPGATVAQAILVLAGFVEGERPSAVHHHGVEAESGD